MQIIFLPSGITSEDLHQEVVDLSSTELDHHKKQFEEIDGSYVLRETNLGGGADIPMFYAILEFAGEFLEKLAIGVTLYKGFPQLQKISIPLKRTVENASEIYIDEDAAKVLAISHLMELHDITEIKLTMQGISRLSDLIKYFPKREPRTFLAHPKSVYHFTFEVNAERFISLLVFWNGEVRVEFEMEKSIFEI